MRIGNHTKKLILGMIDVEKAVLWEWATFFFFFFFRLCILRRNSHPVIQTFRLYIIH